MKNAKERAITDLNVPNGSRDIPFQSQESEQDGHCHFVDIWPSFHLNMISLTQSCNRREYLSAVSQDSFVQIV